MGFWNTLRENLHSGSIVSRGRSSGTISNENTGEVFSEFNNFQNPTWIGLDQLFIAYNSVDLASKVVDILPDDAIRRGVYIEGLSKTQLRRFNAAMQDLKILQVMRQIARYSRLWGDGYGYIVDGGNEASAPSREVLAIVPIGGDLIIPDPDTIEMDMGRPEFNQPTQYLMAQEQGQEPVVIHPERLIRMTHKPPSPIFGNVLPRQRSTQLGLRESLIPRKERIHCGTGVLFNTLQLILEEQVGRKNVMHLLQEASVLAIEDSNLSEKPQDEVRSRLSRIRRLLSNFRLLVLPNGTKGSRLSVQNLGSVNSILKANLDRVTVGADIPAARFLGEMAHGLNASSESSLRVYDSKVTEYQDNQYAPALRLLVPHILRKAGIVDTKEVSFSWPSYIPVSDDQKAEIDSKEITTLNTKLEVIAKILALNTSTEETTTIDEEGNEVTETVENDQENDEMRDKIDIDDLLDQALGNKPVQTASKESGS